MAANCHDELQMKFNELLQVWDLNYKLLRGERESKHILSQPNCNSNKEKHATVERQYN